MQTPPRKNTSQLPPLPPAQASEYFFEEGCFILELLNTPDDPDVSIARARVPPGVTTRWHRLKETVERYVILSGSGRVGVGEQAPRAVVAGNVVSIPALCRQRIANTGEDDLVFLAICTPRFTRDAYEALEEQSGAPGTAD